MAGLHINYSKISTFTQCRKKYWFKFIERAPSNWRPTPGAIIGRGVHQALGRSAMAGSEESGREALDAYLRMPDHAVAGPDTSYYSSRWLYSRGSAASNSFDSADTWTELSLAWYWKNADLAFDAILDRVDELSDESWQIIDWKTGNYDAEDATDLQLDIAHVVLRSAKRLPDQTVVTTIGWNLRHETRRVRVLERRHAVATLRMLLVMARRIDATTEFTASPSRLCSFCDFLSRCDEAQYAALGQLEWADEALEPPLADEAG